MSNDVRMLAVLATTSAASGREVVVAIVGGTMLALSLSRPRLWWTEAPTDGSVSTRRWAERLRRSAERLLTLFLLVMAAYAACTLAEVLSKQLGREFVALLDGAGAFLCLYAWLVHFGPFVREWRLRGVVGAAVLYTCVMYSALIVGLILTGVALKVPFLTGDLRLIVNAILFPTMGWVFYWFTRPKSENGSKAKPDPSTETQADPTKA
jgi:hypothetical protein